MAQMMAMRKNLDERARKKAFDAIFKRFDYNHNGKLFIKDFVEELEMQEIHLDEEEIEKISGFADAEGQISRADFNQYCRHSHLFQSLDKNKDGVVSDIEVTSKAELAFKALDKNHDGFISRKEFTKISKNLTSDQISAVLDKFDKDGDGKLDYEEFKKLLKR